MTDDIILGIASGYTWQDLEPFAVSLKRSGYRGRCLLFTGDAPKDPVPQYGPLPPIRADRSLSHLLSRFGIELCDVGKIEEHPIVARFLLISQFLENKDFRYALCLDTKDIVFQYDPICWLENNMGDNDIVVVSEMQKYGVGEMVGNNKNMFDSYGKELYDKMNNQEVVNGGVIVGRTQAIKSLMLDIYNLTLKDRRRVQFIPGYKEMISDQSALGILIHNDFRNRTLITHPQDGFAFGHPLTRYSIFKDDGKMYPMGSQKPYAIFHQYFDKPEWWKIVRNQYHA